LLLRMAAVDHFADVATDRRLALALLERHDIPQGIGGERTP
jgi:hypothetical protein